MRLTPWKVPRSHSVTLEKRMYDHGRIFAARAGSLCTTARCFAPCWRRSP